MSKRKIVIAYATAGIGHRKAAQAVYEALAAKDRDVEVRFIDVLEYTNLFFKKTYCTTYLFLVNKFGFLWGFFYYFFNIKAVHSLFLPLRRALHLLNSRRLVRFLVEYKPDVVVSTHFLPPDICDYVKKKYAIPIHVINIITDYKVHSFWLSDSIDTYIVGHQKVKDELINKWGIPDDSIKIFGIPVTSKFSEEHDRILLRKKLGISEKSFTVLLMSGGYGVGPVVEILRALDKASFPLAAIAVAGHNKALHRKIEAFRRNATIRIISLGYVDNVDELMAASDICIGKAGGISTSEAAAIGLPFVFVNPIPGQERANADLFVGLGMALGLKGIKNLREIVEGLNTSPGKMTILRERIKRVKKPYAAYNIAEFITTEVKE